MNQEDEIGTFNSAYNEAMVSQLDKQINTEEYLSNAFISNDEAIARELQGQIDLEYNQKLRNCERVQNRSSKLNISYEKYQKYDNCDDYEEQETFNDSDQQDILDWDWDEAVDRTSDSIPSCTYVFTTSQGVVTKHDISLNRQRNMKQPMSLSPNVHRGNGAISHVEIPNSVFNRLKQHSEIEWHKNVHCKEKDENNQHRLIKDKRYILWGVDQSTSDTIHSLLKGDEPCLKQLYGKIAKGKESAIYHGKAAENAERAPCDCILKLYKLDVHDFKLQEKCISGDYRYRNCCNSNMSKYKIICLWAKKEMDNLIRMKMHKIPCPEVIKLKDNVLIMSLIGDNGTCAKKLQYAKMNLEDYKNVYKEVIRNMRIMYKDALLIHGDLSESNILWHNNKCYFIDVSQAVEPGHESAFEYLKRDCSKVIRFFKKKKVENIMTQEELFKYITGYEFDDNDGIELLRSSFKTYVEVTQSRKRHSKPKH